MVNADIFELQYFDYMIMTAIVIRYCLGKMGYLRPVLFDDCVHLCVAFVLVRKNQKNLSTAVFNAYETLKS